MGQDVRSPRGPRCIALVGPFQSGKTTLLEAILARTGAIPRAGSVDAGTSVGDASPEARHHKMGVGLGGNMLVGGSANSIALQPLSVQGQVGLSVAAGLESLELRPGR
jgi:ABC-type bacteriocin/lantibiotic exporter with double-glycine peptidase domain